MCITIVLWITEGVSRLHEKFCAVGTKTNEVVNVMGNKEKRTPRQIVLYNNFPTL